MWVKFFFNMHCESKELCDVKEFLFASDRTMTTPGCKSLHGRLFRLYYFDVDDRAWFRFQSTVQSAFFWPAFLATGSRLLNPIFALLLNWQLIPHEFATLPSWYDSAKCWLKMSKADSLPVCWKWIFWTSHKLCPFVKQDQPDPPSSLL